MHRAVRTSADKDTLQGFAGLPASHSEITESIALDNIENNSQRDPKDNQDHQDCHANTPPCAIRFLAYDYSKDLSIKPYHLGQFFLPVVY